MPNMTTKVEAALWYGTSQYPVQEANLPQVDLAPIAEAIRAHMSKLAHHKLAEPWSIELYVAGNGYTFHLHSDEEDD